MLNKHTSAYTSVSNILKRYERKEKSSVLSTLNKNCKEPCVGSPTEISIETIDKLFKEYDIAITDGLGAVGLVIINLASTPFKNKANQNNNHTNNSNGMWVNYEYDNTINKYILHVPYDIKPLAINNHELDKLTHDIFINNEPISNVFYKVNIDKSSIKDIKDVFYYHLNGLNFDKELINKLNMFRLAWSQKDDIYIEFLGSNLLGVHPIRFSENDENNILVNILNIDKNTLKTDIFNLEDIKKNWKITSNAANLTLMYLMHGFIKSDLSKELKEEALKLCYYIFAYKIMGSLIAWYFKFNVEIPIAKAVYERLSNRFLIKKYGTWQAVFEHRAADVLPGGTHYRRLEELTTIDAMYALSDLQGRLREIVKYIYTVLIEVKNNNEKIYSTSVIEKDEEGEQVKDNTNRPDMYVGYLRSVFNSKTDFINDDLVYLVTKINNKLDIDKFVQTLQYMSDNLQPKIGDKDDILEHTINITISYLRTKNIVGDYHSKAYEILMLMKGYWSSSSVKDVEVKYLKKYTYDIAEKATGKKTSWMLATISISVLLYIFLRSIYKNK